MTFDVNNLSPLVGSEILTDLETLISGARAEEIRQLLDDRGVIVFRGLGIDDESQLAIAKTLGNPLKEGGGKDGVYKVSLDETVNSKADYIRGAFYWHIDGSTQDKPYLGTMLRAVKLSEVGGETEFCNTYAAYDDLPAQLKQDIESLRVVHSMERSLWYIYPEPSFAQIEAWQKVPSKSCPLVWTHKSGRKSLLIGATADYIEGLSHEESRKLIVQLRELATQPKYVFRHQWQVGDLVVWSNTGAMHRAMPYPADSGRLMIRTTLEGEEALH